MQAVVNNAVYMTLLEEARYDYFKGLKGLVGELFPFLLAQTNIVFLAPGRGGSLLDIEIVTTHLGISSIVQAYRVIEAEGGRVLAEAEALLVCYDPQSGNSLKMPEEMHAAVTAFEEI